MKETLGQVGAFQGEQGSGFYTENNWMMKDLLQLMVPDVLQALDMVELRWEDAPFCVCDYGSSDGGTSMELFTQVIGAIKRKYGEKKQVHMTYEDQPTNDFIPLFTKLFDGGEKRGYLQKYSDVYVSSVGCSFFNQVLPDCSVNFGFTNTAFHWLSKRPCNLKNSLFYHVDVDKKEKEAFSEQAARDWEAILLHRAKELCPGGQIFISCAGQSPDGSYPGKRNRVQTMNQIARSMVEDSIISQEEFANMTFTQYLRTEEEMVAPLVDVSSPVYKAGLRFQSIKWVVLDDPVRKRLAEHNRIDKQSLRSYARDFVNSQKVWTYHTILEGVRKDIPEIKRNQIAEEFYKRYEKVVFDVAEKHESETVTAFLNVKKV